MNTFRGDLQLAALGDLDDLDGLVTRGGGVGLDLLHNFVALENLAEDDVAAIEPAVVRVPVSKTSVQWVAMRVMRERRGREAEGRAVGWEVELSLRRDDGGDEELRAVGVLSSVGHGEQALLGVL